MHNDRPPRTIEVLLEPEGKTIIMPRPKTSMRLLQNLNLPTDAALVIRDGGLLTPDREVLPEDRITVRIVTSQG